MKNVGNSTSDGRSQGVPKISGHPCIGHTGALRGHLCDSTAFLYKQAVVLKHNKPRPRVAHRDIARFFGIDQKCNTKKSIENNTLSPDLSGSG